MIADTGWFELVEADIRQVIQGTVLEGAPMLRVSAKTGVGLKELAAAIETCLSGRPARPDLGRPRLPVDRVFTMPGFGTVVTGTLIDGRLKLGEEVEILPLGLRGRIRGLQAHKHKEQAALPGSRTAVNISGLEVDQIHRGDVLVSPGKYQASRMLDVHFRMLKDASGPVRHNSEVKVFLGSAEILARARVLGVDEVTPGQEGWLQLELREPALAVRGDRYIIRRPSPGETLGGGVVVDPQPKGRYRRFSEEVLRRLESLRAGSPAEVLSQAFLMLGVCPVRDAVVRSRLPEDQVRKALEELLSEGNLVLLESGEASPTADGLACSRSFWTAESERAVRELDHYHNAYPLRRGMPREALKSRLKITQARAFNALVHSWAAEGLLEESGSLVWKAGHEVQFSPQQQMLVDRLAQGFIG
jgi:selenocysteine-specific elongation factor